MQGRVHLFARASSLDITSSIASLVADLDSWMSSNRPSLNPSKTQLIWLLCTRQQLLKLEFALLATQFPQFTFLTSVRDLGLLWTTLFLSQLTSLIYPDLASIIYVALYMYVQSNALFPCLYLSLWSMPLSAPGLIIVTPSSLAHQNPAWLHCNLSLMRLLV